MGELGGNKNAHRWEWRTFGARLSDIEAKVGLTAQIAPRQSDEIYLLNSVTPHSAKIRGGALSPSAHATWKICWLSAGSSCLMRPCVAGSTTLD